MASDDAVTVLEGAHVVTVDGSRAEYADGHLVVTGHRITAVGPGPAPAAAAGVRRVDASGCLITPGLVNTDHHLYQWITRGFAVDATLFTWLSTLYPVWGRLDAHLVQTAARGGLTWLAKTGCTTTTDHHYVFPHDGGDLLAAQVDVAQTVGPRWRWAWGWTAPRRTRPARCWRRCGMRCCSPGPAVAPRR